MITEMGIGANGGSLSRRSVFSTHCMVRYDRYGAVRHDRSLAEFKEVETTETYSG